MRQTDLVLAFQLGDYEAPAMRPALAGVVVDEVFRVESMERRTLKAIVDPLGSDPGPELAASHRLLFRGGTGIARKRV